MTYPSSTTATDHNQYVRGNYVYQASYRAGLRILRINNVATADLTEVGFFDTDPNSNERTYNGVWSNYPFFPSGAVIVSDIYTGLFVLKPTGVASNPAPFSLSTTLLQNNGNAGNMFDITVKTNVRIVGCVRRSSE
jgi:hypothetical protein